MPSTSEYVGEFQVPINGQPPIFEKVFNILQLLGGLDKDTNPTCRSSLLTDVSSTNQYWTLSLSDHFWGINLFLYKRNYRIWGQSIIYLKTRHKMGYRVGFTTVKLLKSGQYKKILKISALLGLPLQYFLVLATFSEFNCISRVPALKFFEYHKLILLVSLCRPITDQ